MESAKQLLNKMKKENNQTRVWFDILVGICALLIAVTILWATQLVWGTKVLGMTFSFIEIFSMVFSLIMIKILWSIR
jgi:hypothetical protein